MNEGLLDLLNSPREKRGMKEKVLMVALLLTGTGVGFFLGREFPSKPMAETPAATALAESRARPQNDASSATGKPSLSRFDEGRQLQKLSVTEACQLLRDVPPTGDPLAQARRSYEIQLLLSQLPLEVLQEVAKALAGDSKTPKGLVQTVINAWASRDWKHALEWADGSPQNRQWVGAALEALAAIDPEAAGEAVSQRLGNGRMSLNNNSEYEILADISRKLAKLGGDALMRFLNTLGEMEQVNLLASSANELPEADLVALAEKLYEQTKGGKVTNRMLNEVIDQMALRHSATARKWLEELTSGDSGVEFTMSAATRLAYINEPGGAKELLQCAIKASPGQEKEFFKRMIAPGICNSPILADLASALPPDVELVADDYCLYQQVFLWPMGTAFVDLAKTIRNPQDQANFLVGALDHLAEGSSQGSGPRYSINEVDYRKFQQSLSTLNLTGENAERVQAAMAKAREATTPRPDGG